MLNKEIISSSIPTVGLEDTVFQTLEMMNEYHLSQLAVVLDEKYLGLVFEDDLMNLNENEKIKAQVDRLSKVAVQSGSHFMEAVKIANEYQLSAIPVIEKEGEFIGTISASDLLGQLGKLVGANEQGAIIVLEMKQRSFSFSEICKLVETNDAQITQLNTYWDTVTETLLVTLKVNKFEISDIIATFQRYEYQVKYYFGEELYENELRSNYDHLMNYLNI